MKNHARINGSEKRAADAGPRRDLRAWCMKLDCTETELRETVRAVMRLMASAHWQQRHH